MSECKYCKAESFDRPYCPACAKKYFNMDLPIIHKIESKVQIENKESEIIKNNSIDKIKKSQDLILDNFYYYNTDYLYKRINYKQDFSIHDEDKKYKCNDGKLVRSYGERIIYNWLLDNNIQFEYEKEIKYKVDIVTDYFSVEKEKSIHPDFYIPGPVMIGSKIIQDLYIEYWGIEEKEQYKDIEEYELITKYIKTKEYKLKVYKNLKYQLINLYQKDIINFEKSLISKINSTNIQ